MGYLKSVRDLVPVLGVGKSKAAEIAKEPWLAGLKTDAGWDEDEVRAAIAARGRRDPDAALVAEGEDLQVLEEGGDPLAVARAALRVASKLLASSPAGDGARGALESVKRSLEELRRTEEGCLELAKKRGELIERDVAKTLVGNTVARAVRALERYEAQLAPRVEGWISDAAFRALSSEERARAVRAWAREQAHAVRSVTADEIEKELAAEVEERSA